MPGQWQPVAESDGTGNPQSTSVARSAGNISGLTYSHHAQGQSGSPSARNPDAVTQGPGWISSELQHHSMNSPHIHQYPVDIYKYHPQANRFGHHPTSNPAGYHPEFNPYSYHPEYNPYGYHAEVNMYMFHPKANPMGYHPTHSPIGYHPQCNPQSYHPTLNPNGHHNNNNPDGYHESFNPYGYHDKFNPSGYHVELNPGAYHPTHNPSGNYSGVSPGAYESPNTSQSFGPAAIIQNQVRSASYQQPTSQSNLQHSRAFPTSTSSSEMVQIGAWADTDPSAHQSERIDPGMTLRILPYPTRNSPDP
jgi:hypothetical protein